MQWAVGMNVRSTAIRTLVLAVTFAVSVNAGEWQHAEVSGWVEILESPEATLDQRSAALDGLREASRGQPRQARTREAILAFASLLRPEDEARPNEALQLMQAAAAYYPDDARLSKVLHRLALAQIEAGRSLEAHVTLLNLLQRSDAPDDPELLALATANAARTGDDGSALAWSERFDPTALPVKERHAHWLVRLKSAEALRRYPEANDALAQLQALDAAAFRRDAAALLAAARTEGALGRSDAAVEHYQAFVNVHTRHAERPAALLEQGQLLARLQRRKAALRTFEWLLHDHAESPLAGTARLEIIRADPDLSAAERAEAYRALVDLQPASEHAAEACSRILETLLAAGRPLEALATLARIGRQAPGSGRIQARTIFETGMNPAMMMLADQDDDIGLLAAAALAESLGIALPGKLQRTTREAERRLGLADAADGSLDVAGTAAREGRWEDVAVLLAPPDGGGAPPAHETTVARERLLAELAWRRGRTTEALERIERAIASAASTPRVRPLLVLRADIRLAAGDRATACADYRAASGIDATTWVTRQLTGCPAEELMTAQETHP